MLGLFVLLICCVVFLFVFFSRQRVRISILSFYKCSLLQFLRQKIKSPSCVAASSTFDPWIKSECLGSVPTYFRDATSHLRAPFNHDSSLPATGGKNSGP